MKQFYAEIPIRPVPWQRTGGNERRRYTSKKTRDFEEMVSIYLRANKAQVFTGALCVHLIFNYVKPKTVKRLHHTVVPDIDNLAKGVLDAAKGILWKDDCQIIDLFLSKRYAEKNSITIIVKER